MCEQIEQVNSWIDRSNPTNNAALEHISDAINGGGWTTIDGQKILTGATHCEDGSLGYGLALPLKLPFIENVKAILLCTTLDSDRNEEDTWDFVHMITGFSISDINFFLDSTRGQVTRAHNKVLVAERDRLSELYNLKPWDIQKMIRMRKLSTLNPVNIDDRLLMLDIDPNLLGRYGHIYRYGSKDVNPISVNIRQQPDETSSDWYARYNQAKDDLERERDPNYYRNIRIQDLVIGKNFMNPARYIARRLLDVE